MLQLEDVALLSSLLERDMRRFPLVPVIMRVRGERFDELLGTVRQLVVDALPPLLGNLLDAADVFFGGLREIRRFNMIAFPATQNIIDEFRQDPAVEALFLDRVQRALSTVPPEGVFRIPGVKEPVTTTLWTKRLIGSEEAEREGWTGRGVKIAILDTASLPNHIQIARALSFTTIGRLMTDRNGHGIWCATAAAGIEAVDHVTGLRVVGMAREADLFLIKCLGFVVGTGADSWILSALALADELDADIINMSLGSDNVPPRPEEDPFFQPIKELTEKGRLIVVAAGNCLSGDSLVYTARGPVPIKSVRPGDMVYTAEEPRILQVRCLVPMNIYGHKTFTHRTLKIVNERILLKPVKRVWRQGRRQLYRVRTTTRTIECTSNHPFLQLKNGQLVWTELGRLRVGDVIVIMKGVPERPSLYEDMNPDLLRFLGCYVGDGYYRLRARNKGEVSLYLPPGEIREKYKRIIQSLFGKTVGEHKWGITIYSRAIAELLRELGFQGDARTKSIPEWIFSLPNHLVLCFLEGYIDADANDRLARSHTGAKTVRRVSFEACNKRLMEQLRYLAIKVGWRVSNIWSRTRKISIYNGHRWYHYPNAETFCFDAYPDSHHISSNPEMIDRTGIYAFKKAKYLGLERIREITPTRIDETYDIEVEGTHNFFAEGILVNNSGPAPGSINTPGAMPDAITVGAFNPITGEVAPFSSRGPTPWGEIKPDVIAPGVNIHSGIVGVLDQLTDRRKNRFSPLSGTSMSAPHVAGLLAQMLENARALGFGLTAPMVKEMMARFGHVKNNEEGWGRLTWGVWKQFRVGR